MAGESVELSTEQPQAGYLDEEKILKGVRALKDYIKKSKALKLTLDQRKNLLEAGEKDPSGLFKVMVEVVFKNIPTNRKTYIHTVLLPHHWRLATDLEDYNIALFVRHRRADTEAQKIQFAKDRDLDVENSHSYYQNLLDERLSDELKSKISRIITTKELATEYNTFQKMDRLSKTYDLFLSDKQLMANKMNPLPRRLGRRFWVRERKVPLMVKMSSKHLDACFQKVFKTEPFYVMGNSSTEKIQLGVISQPNDQLVSNIDAFLKKLHILYGDNVRFLRLRTNWGISLPLYADLTSTCPQVTMRKRRIRPRPVVDEFDMLDVDAKVSVRPSGSVKIIKQKRKRTTDAEDEISSTPKVKSSKRVKRSA